MSSGTRSSRKRRSDTRIVSSRSESHPAMSSLSESSPDNNNNNKVSAADAAPRVKLKVRLKRFHAVAAWSWNASDDVCAVCQTEFEGTAPGVKYPGEDCPVVWGRCGHAFHLQCVSKWLGQASSKNSCPNCRQEWEFGSNPVSGSD